MMRATKTRGVLGFNVIHKKQIAISIATILLQSRPISSCKQYSIASRKSKLRSGK
jgi:hypothetical protein